MRNKYKIIMLLLVILSACSQGEPEISIGIQAFEFGDVINGEVLTKDIKVINIGAAPLTIESVSTSCGCTTASIDASTINPGDSATLHIEFDSGAHGPELTGEFSRQIFIGSNDLINPEVTINLNANVLPSEK